eukprot:2015465-Pleurochrysis_carterae.AAC.1
MVGSATDLTSACASAVVACSTSIGTASAFAIAAGATFAVSGADDLIEEGRWSAAELVQGGGGSGGLSEFFAPGREGPGLVPGGCDGLRNGFEVSWTAAAAAVSAAGVTVGRATDLTSACASAVVACSTSIGTASDCAATAGATVAVATVSCCWCCVAGVSIPVAVERDRGLHACGDADAPACGSPAQLEDAADVGRSSCWSTFWLL